MRDRKFLRITKKLDQLHDQNYNYAMYHWSDETPNRITFFLFFEFRVQSTGNPRAHRARVT